MDQERTRYILDNPVFGDFRYAFQRKCNCAPRTIYEDGITEEEDLEIKKVWRSMPGNTTYYDAVCRIANHKCSDNDYRCQSFVGYQKVCEFVSVVDEDIRLCPICGENAAITGRTTDGRIIRACGDAHIRPDERKHYVTMN